MLLNWADIIEKLIICTGVFAIALLVAMYSTWWERKFAAWLQDRKGPNRAGPLGILQPVADGVKMFMKEEIIPNVSNKFLFILGPSLAMLTACMTGSVIQWGKDFNLNGRVVELQITDLNIGILYILGVVSFGVYGIMIGGWASNNKYSLLGAVRASSQMISYEIAMGLSIISLVILSGTLSFRQILDNQDAGLCYAVLNPLGFLIFFICALAETNRAPFDLPECESELIGGYHTEYSSMKLGFYLFAEYINMFISSAVMAGLFFGGYNFPFAKEVYSAMGLADGHWAIAAIGFTVYFIKICIFISIFMWIRWTLPRFRYDQLMNLGWKVLIPLSILNIFIVSLIKYFFD
jgi:NADH-quinone oxidoreductase subunit H